MGRDDAESCGLTPRRRSISVGSIMPHSPSLVPRSVCAVSRSSCQGGYRSIVRRVARCQRHAGRAEPKARVSRRPVRCRPRWAGSGRTIDPTSDAEGARELVQRRSSALRLGDRQQAPKLLLGDRGGHTPRPRFSVISLRRSPHLLIYRALRGRGHQTTARPDWLSERVPAGLIDVLVGRPLLGVWEG